MSLLSDFWKSLGGKGNPSKPETVKPLPEIDIGKPLTAVDEDKYRLEREHYRLKLELERAKYDSSLNARLQSEIEKAMNEGLKENTLEGFRRTNPYALASASKGVMTGTITGVSFIEPEVKYHFKHLSEDDYNGFVSKGFHTPIILAMDMSITEGAWTKEAITSATKEQLSGEIALFHSIAKRHGVLLQDHYPYLKLVNEVDAAKERLQQNRRRMRSQMAKKELEDIVSEPFKL